MIPVLLRRRRRSILAYVTAPDGELDGLEIGVCEQLSQLLIGRNSDHIAFVVDVGKRSRRDREAEALLCDGNERVE